jgi:hypothetical protein
MPFIRDPAELCAGSNNARIGAAADGGRVNPGGRELQP